ncbi:endoprotease [simian adenovirus 22]|uniref:Endoprotease n=1 Tax=simian adenovirus 22 TaxID=175569 RepID=Q6QPH5_9ADEN|nr:endoprotease [Simian adenovirus E22]
MSPPFSMLSSKSSTSSECTSPTAASSRPSTCARPSRPATPPPKPRSCFLQDDGLCGLRRAGAQGHPPRPGLRALLPGHLRQALPGIHGPAQAGLRHRQHGRPRDRGRALAGLRLEPALPHLLPLRPLRVLGRAPQADLPVRVRGPAAPQRPGHRGPLRHPGKVHPDRAGSALGRLRALLLHVPARLRALARPPHGQEPHHELADGGAQRHAPVAPGGTHPAPQPGGALPLPQRPLRLLSLPPRAHREGHRLRPHESRHVNRVCM